MKPRVKNDSWCYTASSRPARRRVKRLAHKRHRRNDRNILKEEEHHDRIDYHALQGA